MDFDGAHVVDVVFGEGGILFVICKESIQEQTEFSTKETHTGYLHEREQERPHCAVSDLHAIRPVLCHRSHYRPSEKPSINVAPCLCVKVCGEIDEVDLEVLRMDIPIKSAGST